MGRPKEWLDFEGEPMLSRVVRIVGSVCRPVVVAARPGQALPPLSAGVEIVLDRFDDVGPLAGIETALSSLVGRADAAFVTGCDHPHLSPAFLLRLVESLGDAAAIVLSDAGGIRPLPGIYRVDSLPTLRGLLDEGEHRVHIFAERIGARPIEVEDLRIVDSNLDSLQNLNEMDSITASMPQVGTAFGPTVQNQSPFSKR